MSKRTRELELRSSKDYKDENDHAYEVQQWVWVNYTTDVHGGVFSSDGIEDYQTSDGEKVDLKRDGTAIIIATGKKLWPLE